MANPVLVKANGALYLDLADGSGTRIQVADNDPLRATFSAFIPGISPASNTPTDIVVLQGSNSRKVWLRQLIITGQANSATNVQILVNRRSAANTGGVLAPVTVTSRDSTDAGPTASLGYYTTQPTGLGSSAGIADGGRLNLAPAANGSIDRLVIQQSWFNDKAMILNSASEFLCIGMNGVQSLAGIAANFDLNLVFSET